MSDIGIIKEDEFKISVCKYYLPCGWCELKQKECGKCFAIMYPRNYEPYMPNTTLVYAAPTAEPKKGKWHKRNNMNYSPFDGSSEYTFTCGWCGGETDRKTNYCPNCGAKMERSKE